MPLTIDRPNVTAAQLNSLWSTLVSRVAPTLPVSIRDPNGDGSSVFDSVDLDESDPEARRVLEPIDLTTALVSKGTGFGGAVWIRTSLDGQIGTRIEVREIYSQAATTFASVVSARDVLPPLFSQTDVLVNGSTGLTISAERVVSTAAGGWGLSTVIGDVEDFEGLGLAEWNPGTVGLITEVEDFDGIGLGGWYPGPVYQIGQVEARWSGWPAGVEPVIPGGVECLSTEDLTSQIDGQRVAFVTAATFEAGSLRVYLNGQRLSGSMVTETGSSGFTISEIVPEIGDALVVDFCSC